MKWNERITLARQRKGLSKTDFWRLLKVSSATATNWENGVVKSIKGENLVNVCRVLGVTEEWLLHGIGEIGENKINEPISDYKVLPATEGDETGAIEYWNVRGSCGGGFLNYEQMPKGHLLKESTFFKKYNLKPENAFAIYADGDSMAEFIVDGDIVIFDKSKTTPISGQIFAIEHPDGLRIKVLRRSIDGSWTLESKNPDKRGFPDEVIPASQADLLKIHGQFVYRQGG